MGETSNITLSSDLERSYNVEQEQLLASAIDYWLSDEENNIVAGRARKNIFISIQTQTICMV
jgi:hypothetical protein